MARLRYNNVLGTLGASLTSSGTTITFASAPAFATLASGQYIPLVLDPPTSAAPSGTFEIVHLTSYTSGATSGTIARGQEGTTGQAHANGANWVQGPVVVDGSASGVNVMEYGAKGDGVTDDSAAVVSAMNAANTIGAAKSTIVNVVFPSGYNFLLGGGSLMQIPNYVRLWCYGATITSNVAGTGNPLFNCLSNPTVSVEICGGTWLGSGNEANQQLVQSNKTNGCRDIVIRDMYINNWGSGPIVFDDPTRLKYLDNVLISPGLGTMDTQNALNVNFVEGAASLGEIVIRGNIVEQSASFAIAVVSNTLTNNGPKKVVIADNVTTGAAPTVTLSATNGSATVTNVTLPSGNRPALSSTFVINGTGFATNASLTMSGTVSGQGTLGSFYTGTTGSTTATITRDGGAIMIEFDDAATNSEFIVHHNDVYASGLGSFSTAIEIGAVGTSPPGRAIVDSNIVNISSSAAVGSGAIGIYSTNNPADVNVTNNLCTGRVLISDNSTAVPAVQHGNRISAGGSQGRATLVAGTKTVSTAEIQSGDNVVLTVVTPGGTRGMVQLGTITAGTSFVINSIQPGTASTLQTSDTSTVFWQIVH